jgi:hypothetical protein
MSENLQNNIKSLRIRPEVPSNELREDYIPSGILIENAFAINVLMFREYGVKLWRQKIQDDTSRTVI